ncbi:MAG: sigma-70 family RNA polymerase sigma factor, partial [Planctomycetota bacterium]
MSHRPFDVEQQLQQHGASLRQLARELLRDPAAADDAVQEVWLGALRRPPRHASRPSGWLATALRNAARRLRRGEARRARREALAMRPDMVEDHAQVAAREELLHRLVAAVSALEKPYREAIWARYFEDKAPRAIAASSGVPVATVKSRLQRGLGMLREKLGEEGESDWRGAMAGAFGLGEGTVTVSVAASAAFGGLLMATWLKMTALVAAVAIAAVVWWPRDVTVVPTTRVAATGSEASSTPEVGGLERTGADAVVAVHELERREATPLAAKRAERSATIVGRCLDTRGAPLEGCIAEVTGTARNSLAMDEWRRDHDEPERVQIVSPPTGNDGTFSLEFVPPPPFSFYLSVRRDGCVWMGDRWSELAEGASIDVGDVVMEPGVLVRGRVIDAQGRSIPDVQVDTEQASVPEARVSRLRRTSYLAARSREDGAFTFHAPLPIGTYSLRVSDGYVVQSPRPLELSATHPIEDVVLVVVPPPGAATISGRVLDDGGEPVSRATIQVVGQEMGQSRSATSRLDGKFTLRRAIASGETVQLIASADGFESSPPGDPVAWGTTDLEVVLKRGGALVVQVVDEAGAPVPDFSVRCLPVAGTGHQMVGSQDTRVRARGPFVDGIATVPGITPGTWLLVVEFSHESLFLRVIDPLDLTSPSGRRHLVRARRAT